MNKPLFPEISVNGRTVPAAEIAAEAQNHAAPAGKPGIAWRKAARALVIRALLLQEAARLGLKPEPQQTAPGQRETDDEALIRAAMEAGVNPAPVSEQEARAHYLAHRDRFRSPTLCEVSHILFAAPPDDAQARAQARARAENALARLAERPDDFAALARDLSDCPSRESGGRLGQIGPGDTVPEFEAALTRLRPGETAPRPVDTRYGLHIVRLIARAEGAPLPYEAVAASIRDSLEKAAWARAARAFTARLVDRATITGIDMTAPLGRAPGTGNSPSSVRKYPRG